VDELERSRKLLLAAVTPLTQAELDDGAEPGAWSVGEILHHLQLMDELVARLLEKQVERAEKAGLGPDPGGESLMHSLDGFSVIEVVDKLKAPAMVSPTRGMDRQVLLDGLASARRALRAGIEKGSGRDLGQLRFPHPVLGSLTMYQWILFTAQHEQRHLNQVRRLTSRKPGKENP
jgi:hypothetical protein